ncbi:hypothetical protein [Bradyrhizobium viridifuturi]|uniref:hypothetical protein n=1 Tax=Bradyrhizobium viridifuturi TaxID=1654716 RepID=UPI00067F4E0B|nr:hypothetical protein [Bradyrhizobium viridifuturi]
MNDTLDMHAIAAALEAGELKLRELTKFERRDPLIRQTYVRFYPGNPKGFADSLNRYHRVAWLRERSLEACPQHRIGKPEEMFWRILKVVPTELSAYRIKKIIEHF